jgi:uncharacterized protein (TIGR02145 family)
MKLVFLLVLSIIIYFPKYAFSQSPICFEKSGNRFISSEYENGILYSLINPLSDESLSDLTKNIFFENRNDQTQKQLTENINFHFKKGVYNDLRDGKTYKTIKIGKQTWMAENLRYASTGECWCYNDSSINCNKYGRLYDWSTAKESCPKGWHLPSEDEWTIMVNYIGGEEIAGGKLKSKSGWNNPNEGATDSCGFSALAGGYRFPNGGYFYAGMFGSWWTSTEGNATFAWNRGMTYNNTTVYRSFFSKTYGRSVRCIED